MKLLEILFILIHPEVTDIIVENNQFSIWSMVIASHKQFLEIIKIA